jgi:hypothetical protein
MLFVLLATPTLARPSVKLTKQSVDLFPIVR